MKRERITNILLAIIALLLAIYIYVTLRNQGLIDIKVESAVKSAVGKEMSQVKIPKPINGRDARPEQIKSAVNAYISNNPPANGRNGINATDEQVSKAVNNYFAKHPVSVPKDGMTPVKGRDYVDGINGATPQLRCNIVANRWEVRYGSEDNWQLLNGEKVKCTTEVL